MKQATNTDVGYSQSSVTAGLIGGRLGNKGGVAISLKLDGTTFLFLNAHLAGTYPTASNWIEYSYESSAAHEDKAALRLSNMTKIKVRSVVKLVMILNVYRPN